MARSRTPRTPWTRRLVLLATATVLAAGGAAVSVSAFTAPTTLYPGSGTLVTSAAGS